MRRLLLFVVVLGLLGVGAVCLVTPADRLLNRTRAPAVSVSAPGRALHDSLWIGDFHNDALLWNRSLLERHARGQVDLHRLRTGGFELAVFSATTRMHIDSNYHRTLPVLDILPVIAVASHWPRRAWFDPYQRALVLARKLRSEANASQGQLRLVTTRAEMVALTHAQASGDSVIGAVLLLEGLHALDGEVAHVDSLFAAGYRVFGIAHMFDNDTGGSAHGWHQGGLTPLGRRVVARIDSLGGIIDLAHASRTTIDDVLALTSRPVLVSHTGLTSTCAGPRNLPDDVVIRIAERGGMIAIGFWGQAVCGKDAPAVAHAIRHAIDVAGADHVALGSDFDGGVVMPFDAGHLAMLTSALVGAGLTRDEIRAVMGENEKRFLLAMLPSP